MRQDFPFAVFTVLHTGTNFIQRFFNDLGFKEQYYRVHSPSLRGNILPPHIKKELVDKPVIVTARDPYLSAFHYLSLPYQKDMGIKNIVKRWNFFINILPQLNHYIVDVGCDKKERHNTLRNAVSHIGYDPDKFEPQILEYASLWKPLNKTNNKMKKEYLKDGTLPAGYDWQDLEKAVNWYSSLETQKDKY